MLSNIAYGEHEDHILDVYFPSVKKVGSPVIFMAHGGAWRIGNKDSSAVVKNKVAHWVAKGFVFISVNYRLLPKAGPTEQAEDVEKAILFSQKNAHKWGGSPNKFILMGHSSGAHLVSLISVHHNAMLTPWLGTIALDSAAYDVEKIMKSSSTLRLYKKAFGKLPDYWKKASPFHGLKKKLAPFLAVCSSKRKDNACAQAQSFINKANTYDSQAKLLQVAFSHRGINVELGKDYCYTQAVDAFLKTLHASATGMLVNEVTSKAMPVKENCALVIK